MASAGLATSDKMQAKVNATNIARIIRRGRPSGRFWPWSAVQDVWQHYDQERGVTANQDHACLPLLLVGPT